MGCRRRVARTRLIPLSSLSPSRSRRPVLGSSFSAARKLERITVSSLGMWPGTPIKRQNSVSAYNGPDFEDLDENLQEALDEYLAEMGMSDDVCDFVDASALDKEQREYMGWLT